MPDTITDCPELVTHRKTPKKAALSGWIGIALEFYDFFNYASSKGAAGS
jgi:hypothetical protein